MRLDPVQDPPSKLEALVRHFKEPGASVFAVTQEKTDLQVSAGLARKVRDLVGNGRLDWVLARRRASTQVAQDQSTKGDALAASVQILHGQKNEHRRALMSALLEVHGIDPMALHHYDLAVFYSLPHEPHWPVPRGQIYSGNEGSLVIKLDVEEKLEWTYLQQHLLSVPIWEVLDECKRAMSADIARRLELLGAVIGRVERPLKEDGLGMKVVTDMPYMGGKERAVSLYYAFTIHDQALSRALGLQHLPLRREALFPQERTSMQTIHLGDRTVINSPDPDERERAAEFLLKVQEEWISLPEAEAAVEAYQLAEKATEQVNREIDRLRLAVVFPPGSTCDACRTSFI